MAHVLLRPTLAIVRFGADIIVFNDTLGAGEDAFLAAAAQRILPNPFGSSPLDPSYDSTLLTGDLGTVSISGFEITISAGAWLARSIGLFSNVSAVDDFIMRARYTNELNDGANIEVFQTSPETLDNNVTPGFPTEGDNSHPSHNFLILPTDPHVLTYRACNLNTSGIGGLRLGLLELTFWGP